MTPCCTVTSRGVPIIVSTSGGTPHVCCHTKCTMNTPAMVATRVSGRFCDILPLCLFSLLFTEKISHPSIPYWDPQGFALGHNYVKIAKYRASLILRIDSIWDRSQYLPHTVEPAKKATSDDRPPVL